MKIVNEILRNASKPYASLLNIWHVQLKKLTQVTYTFMIYVHILYQIYLNSFSFQLHIDLLCIELTNEFYWLTRNICVKIISSNMSHLLIFTSLEQLNNNVHWLHLSVVSYKAQPRVFIRIQGPFSLLLFAIKAKGQLTKLTD